MLPLSHPLRIKQRDDKLWNRELKRADTDGDPKLHCPCMECKGNYRTTRKTARNHLAEHGRYPACRVWTGAGGDESDDEWATSYATMGAAAIKAASRRLGGPGVQPSMEKELDSSALLERGVEGIDPLVEDKGAYEGGVQGRGTLERELEITQRLEGIRLAVEQEAVAEAAAGAATLEPFDLDAVLDTGITGPLEEERDTEVPQAEGVNEEGLHSDADLEEVLKPLFTGCKIDLISFVLLFLNIAHNHGFTNGGVSEVLSLLADHTLLDDHCLPRTLYSAKQILRKLGLDYEKIPVCVNNYFLFRGKENAKLDACPVCEEPKMKKVGNSMQIRKVVRYFPIIPRLKRLFATSGTSKLMTWHQESKSVDGKVRHPAGCKAWKHVDEQIDPEFAQEPRNVRMALGLDGVNPYGDNSRAWSTWPVILFNYDLPPWLVTKKFFIILAMLLPGKDSVTEEQIDVLMAPLVDDLKQLWEDGVECFDVLDRPTLPRKFKLRAMVMWTINDYPGYGLISGQQHNGYKGCVICGPNCVSRHSKHTQKITYGESRHWLPLNHVFRNKKHAVYFDGTVETRPPPPRMSSADRQQWGKDAAAWLSEPGASVEDEDCPTRIHGVKRVTCLYKLPYWDKLLINHCLDAMHCEKNIAHNLVQTIMGTKDTEGVRRDMKAMRVQEHLWLTQNPNPKKHQQNAEPVHNSIEKQIEEVDWMPQAPYCLSREERIQFLEVLLTLKVPSMYSSSLARCVSRKKKLSGLKSHDYHQLLQQILPLATDGLLAGGPRLAIIRVSQIWRQICAKVYDPTTYNDLMTDVALTLCTLEMHFPPSFFVVMTHLMVHVTEELDLCGPVSVRWMYPVERYLKVLKGYVRNKAQPEASMAEGYMLAESLHFVSERLIDAKGKGRRTWESEEDPGDSGVALEGAKKDVSFSWEDMMAMHHYVLENEPIIQPWYRLYDAAKEEVTRGRSEFKKQWARDARN
ncbi:unnamed protein product [Calypogeia fissa]